VLSLGGLSVQTQDPSALAWVEAGLPEAPGSLPATSHVIAGDGATTRFFYRSFSAPVMLVPDAAGGAGDLAWTSRGEGPSGTGYAESATIHVASTDPLSPAPGDERDARNERPVPGAPMYAVAAKVTNLSEEREPLAVVTLPDGGGSRLLALETRPAATPHGSSLVALEAPLPAPGIDALELRRITFPEEALDGSWMRRPPVVLRAHPGRGSRIVFSRFHGNARVDDVEGPALEIALSERVAEGWSAPTKTTCALRRVCGGTTAKCASADVAFAHRLASGQMIVADVDADAAPDVVLVDEDDPDRTVLLLGDDGDGRYRLAADSRYLRGVEVACGPPTGAPRP